MFLNKNGRWIGVVAACAAALALNAGASVVGTNLPAESLTRARIATLPHGEQRLWLQYLERSNRQRQADKDAFHSEMKRAGVAAPIEPPHSNSARSIPLSRPPEWYASTEARHIADVIVSFQTPAGGWGKNTDMSKDLRAPGEAYTTNNLSRFLTPGDFDTPREPEWNYVGTIDNDATTTQMNFLAKTISAGGGDATVYRESFLRGMEYLFKAQFPNGGWPQVWPLEGGYHDAITFNDDAMTQVMELMHRVAEGQHEFSFVPEEIRRRAADSFERGVRCILAIQIVSGGRRTAWAQQYDALTLAPVSARNFELPAASGSEGANVLMLLMESLPKPSVKQQIAIRAAEAWFRKTAIFGQSWERSQEEGGHLVTRQGAGPIWARYYQIGTDKPIFADRDKTIHDNVSELSRERRSGYGWYTTDPVAVLERFEKWNREHPETK